MCIPLQSTLANNVDSCALNAVRNYLRQIESGEITLSQAIEAERSRANPHRVEFRDPVTESRGRRVRVRDPLTSPNFTAISEAVGADIPSALRLLLTEAQDLIENNPTVSRRELMAQLNVEAFRDRFVSEKNYLEQRLREVRLNRGNTASIDAALGHVNEMLTRPRLSYADLLELILIHQDRSISESNNSAVVTERDVFLETAERAFPYYLILPTAESLSVQRFNQLLGAGILEVSISHDRYTSADGTVFATSDMTSHDIEHAVVDIGNDFHAHNISREHALERMRARRQVRQSLEAWGRSVSIQGLTRNIQNELVDLIWFELSHDQNYMEAAVLHGGPGFGRRRLAELVASRYSFEDFAKKFLMRIIEHDDFGQTIEAVDLQFGRRLARMRVPRRPPELRQADLATIVRDNPDTAGPVVELLRRFWHWLSH